MTYVLNIIRGRELHSNLTVSSKTAHVLYTNISHCLVQFYTIQKVLKVKLCGEVRKTTISQSTCYKN